MMSRLEKVEADVSLDDFRQERIHRTPAGRQSQKNRCTVPFRFESLLDPVQLTPQPPQPVEQLLFVLDGMCHSRPPYTP